MKKLFTNLKVALTLLLLCGVCNVWGETATYQHVFNAKPDTGNGITLSGVSWNISDTNLGSYNSGNYAGVQIGSSSKAGTIELTSASDWNYNGKTKITEIRLWLNSGGSSVSPTVTIGGTTVESDGTSVTKNSSAGKDWTKATKVTFTPTTNNTGVVVIKVSSSKAGYVCAMEIDCEESTTPTKTLESIAVSGTPTKTTYYVGEEFDHAGLTVTGTYDDASTDEITSEITWKVTPSPLTAGTTSVDVVATVGSISSAAYRVSGLTVNEAPALPSYTLVTDASTLKAGDKILIVGIESDTYYALAPYVSGNNCKRNEVSAPVDNVITTSVADITLGGDANAWTLFDGTYYLYAAGSTSSNYLKGAENATNQNAQWTIDTTNDGKATIKCVDSGVTRNIIRHNTGSDLFSCYNSGQADVYIYKLVEPQTKDITISSVGYATAYIPFAATISNEANDVKAYYVTVEGSSAKLNEITGTIPANTGVVLQGTAGTATFTETTVAATTDVTNNLLDGTTDEDGKDFEDSGFTYYILANGSDGIGFYWDGEHYDEFEGMGAHCAQYKAILAVPTSTGAAPRFFSFDEASGINAVTKENVSNGARFNLNGQVVGNGYKGIIIMNGKKFYNK